jgi:hypothetical protein
MKQLKVLSLCLVLLISNTSISQIGAFVFDPDQSSELDLVSTNRGLLIPRIELSLNLNSSSPVNSPTEGLLIFNMGVHQEFGYYYWSGSIWKMLKTDTGNEITGPSSSTDNAVVRFDGTTGRLIQNSLVILNDYSNLTQVNNLSTLGFTLSSNPSIGKILVSDETGEGTWQSAPPIDVEHNSNLITPNVNQLNFEGGCNVFENSDEKATVRYYLNNVTKDVIQLSSSDSGNTNVFTGVYTIPWDIEQHKDHSTFVHSNSNNSSQVKVTTGGIYEVNYMFSILNNTIMRKTIRTRFLKNNIDTIPYVVSYSFSYNVADDKVSHISSSFLIDLEANDYIEVITNGQTNPGSVTLLPNENVLFIRLIREL